MSFCIYEVSLLERLRGRVFYRSVILQYYHVEVTKFSYRHAIVIETNTIECIDTQQVRRDRDRDRERE